VAYPTGAEYPANAVALNPTLQSSLLNGLTTLEQAFVLLDDAAGLGGRVAVNMLTHAPANVVAGTWARVANGAGYLYRGYYGNDATKAQNDAVEVDLYTPSAGIYSLVFNAPQMTDAPILKVYIDTVQVGLTSGYDLYAAALGAQNIIGISGLSLTAAKHRVKFLCFDKNGLSTDYLLRLQAIALKRTA
jgi:hypothetical protein